jgi:hypothetical protein
VWRREHVLAWYLRAYGAVLLAALPAMVVPTSWLAWSHEALGLGPWPDLPLLEYLARSASGVYASFGAVALIASFDVRRYRPIILFLGLVGLPGGAYLLALGLAVKLPLWWTLTEGPGVVLTSLPLLLLSRPAAGSEPAG